MYMMSRWEAVTAGEPSTWQAGGIQQVPDWAKHSNTVPKDFFRVLVIPKNINALYH